MPVNTQTESCISREGGALVFWSPGREPKRQGSRVQIVDVFSLQVATGYTRDPQGRLLLEVQPSLAAGRSWSLAKATQLIRNDARPHRWVALQQNKHAWGLFWAGGGLQRCRDLLADQVSEAEACTALVPATPEALLRLVLELAPETPDDTKRRPWCKAAKDDAGFSPGSRNPWNLVAWTSLAWMAVLGITVAGFLGVLERQERKLDLLLKGLQSQEQSR